MKSDEKNVMSLPEVREKVLSLLAQPHLMDQAVKIVYDRFIEKSEQLNNHEGDVRLKMDDVIHILADLAIAERLPSEFICDPKQIQTLFNKYDLEVKNTISLINFRELFQNLLCAVRDEYFPPQIRFRREFFVQQRRNVNLEQVYEMQEKLGQGQFGTVYKVKEKGSGTIRCCKVVAKAFSKISAEQARNELNVLRMLDHSNIMRVFECFEDRVNLYLICEMIEGFDLQDLLLQHVSATGRGLSEETAKKIFRIIVSALAHCHKKRVMHKDLKPANVMIIPSADDQEKIAEIKKIFKEEHASKLEAKIKEGYRLPPSNSKEAKNRLHAEQQELKNKILSAVEIGNGRPKIVDFGLAELFQPGSLSRTFGGTPYYMAPEVFKGVFNYKCDVWSAGVLLYVILSGYLPFSASSAEEFKRIVEISEPQFPQSLFSHCSPEVVQLLKQLLEKDVSKRPTAPDLLSHPWIALHSATTTSSSKDVNAAVHSNGHNGITGLHEEASGIDRENIKGLTRFNEDETNLSQNAMINNSHIKQPSSLDQQNYQSNIANFSNNKLESFTQSSKNNINTQNVKLFSERQSASGASHPQRNSAVRCESEFDDFFSTLGSSSLPTDVRTWNILDKSSGTMREFLMSPNLEFPVSLSILDPQHSSFASSADAAAVSLDAFSEPTSYVFLSDPVLQQQQQFNPLFPVSTPPIPSSTSDPSSNATRVTSRAGASSSADGSSSVSGHHTTPGQKALDPSVAGAQNAAVRLASLSNAANSRNQNSALQNDGSVKLGDNNSGMLSSTPVDVLLKKRIQARQLQQQSESQPNISLGRASQIQDKDKASSTTAGSSITQKDRWYSSISSPSSSLPSGVVIHEDGRSFDVSEALRIHTLSHTSAPPAHLLGSMCKLPLLENPLQFISAHKDSTAAPSDQTVFSSSDTTAVLRLIDGSNDNLEAKRRRRGWRLVLYARKPPIVRAVLNCVAMQYAGGNLPALQAGKLFQALDINNDGELSVQEMMNGLKFLGVPEALVGEVAAGLDVAGIGTVTYTQWLAAILNYNMEGIQGAIYGAFRQLDIDDDGIISIRDLNELTSSEGGGLGGVTPEDALDAMDKDGSRSVDFNEFRRFVEKECMSQ